MAVRRVAILRSILTGLTRPQTLRADLLAGLSTGAVVIPKALGYASIAGLAVQVGLYTCLTPMVVYAVLGTSRALSVSTTTTLAILTATELNEAAPGADPDALIQSTALLTLMVGGALLLASILKLGFIANFISEPVLVGFKAGIAVVIVVDQLPKLLGLHFTKASFLHNVYATGLNLGQTSIPTLVVGTLALAGLAVLERSRPHWPTPLIIVGLAIAAVAGLGMDGHGVEVVGAIAAGPPPLTLPDPGLAGQLWPGALGIALMSFTETAAVGRAFVRNDEPTPQPNRELLATGVANILGALTGAMPAGGGATQTAVNRLTGARTQAAALVTAAMSLLAMLYLTPLIALIPQAVLASIVIFYSIGLVKLVDFRNILAIRRTEFLWALAAALGVVLIGTLKGIVTAIIISIIALAQQAAHPPVHVLGRKPGTNVFRPRSSDYPRDEFFPGLLLLRIEGRVFFLNAERIAETIRPLLAQMRPNVVVLDLSGVFDLEYSALKMLTEAERRQREAGVQLWLVGLTPEVLATVRRSPLAATLGRERLLFNLEIAVEKFRALPQPALTDAGFSPAPAGDRHG